MELQNIKLTIETERKPVFLIRFFLQINLLLIIYNFHFTFYSIWFHFIENFKLSQNHRGKSEELDDAFSLKEIRR